jgi:sulfide dehydrogenase [flavocytochrome c] flavoprotein subunit
MTSTSSPLTQARLQRRTLLQSTAALGLLGLAGCATSSIPARAKVVVIGGGYGGATAAKYVRMFSDYKIDVVLIEPQDAFVSCPISNLVLSGGKQIADLTVPYTALSRRHGITVVKDMARRSPWPAAPPSATTNWSSLPALSCSWTASRA